MDKKTIKIGAGKGKLLEVTNEYLKALGFEPIDKKSRVLTHYRESVNYILEITLLRWEDIKTYANSFDMIVFGSDQWLENGKKSMIALKHFEQKNCRLSLMVPKEMVEYPVSYFTQKRVATGYPEIAKRYIGVKEENIIKMTGSVEASIKLGWADSIFDIVESGETALENGLVEKKEFIKFGAVLATTKPEKISLYQKLGLVDKPATRKIIAFDGVDGGGKSTLAKHFVQTGLGDSNPIVLMCPYSGYIGVSALSLLEYGNVIDWAYLIGDSHWRPTLCVNMVYDRNILTCMTELLKYKIDNEVIKGIMESWKPLPDVIFWCNASLSILKNRVTDRGIKDKFDENLGEYIELYNKAVEWISNNTNIKVIEIDTGVEVEESLKNVYESLKEIYK